MEYKNAYSASTALDLPLELVVGRLISGNLGVISGHLALALVVCRLRREGAVHDPAQRHEGVEEVEGGEAYQSKDCA